MCYVKLDIRETQVTTSPAKKKIIANYRPHNACLGY